MSNKRYRIRAGAWWCAVLALSGWFTAAAQAEPVYLLEYHTHLGSYLVELYDDTPVAKANYLSYVNQGQQDGLLIHRKADLGDSGVQVIQGGGIQYANNTGFTSAPVGTPVDFDQEATHSNVRGTIAMAENNLGYTSQWFINTGDNLVLDDNDSSSPVGEDPDDLIFVVFGEVVEGMDVVDDIYALKTYDYASRANDPNSILNSLGFLPYDDGRSTPVNDEPNGDELVVTEFVVLIGDANFDSVLDAADIDETIALVGNNLGAANIFNDVDRDGGVTDNNDVHELIHEIFGTVYGDANLDGKVGPADLTALKMHWGQSNIGWAGGSFNGVGTVSQGDLNDIAENWGFNADPATGTPGPSPTGIPEPASLMLLGCGALWALTRRQ